MIEPSAKAFKFVIDGQGQQYDAYLDLAEGAGIDRTIDCRYRVAGSSGGWVWLAGETVYPSELETTLETDTTFNAAIDNINAKIEEVFGTASDVMPEKGFERIEWLIQVGLVELNNVISRI